MVVLGAAILAVTVIWQLWLRQYNAWVYWLAVSMVAVFGTMAAGILHVYMGIPYIFSAAIYAVAVTVIFVLWYLSEKTLSVHSINTRRREVFYWAAVLGTFAMGTAVGDMTAVSFNLRFFASGILFAVVIAIPRSPQRDRRLLVRLHHHQAVGSVVRGLARGALDPGRFEPRQRRCQHCLVVADRGIRRVSRHQPQGRFIQGVN